MRLHLSINAPKNTIPFDHQHLLVGTIHKWLGWNEEHGKVALYSFSRLMGGKKSGSELIFNGETTMFFSAYDPEITKRIVQGIMDDKTMFHCFEVKEIQLMDDPDLTQQVLFYPASPVFIKRWNGKKVDHILYDDPRAGEYLKETLLTKMAEVGLEDDTLEINFDKAYLKAGTKMVVYNGVKNKANWCPVLIKGKQETKLFAWNVGLGNSTGIGFGAIM
jgi:CRISPR-associated endoribonuclease Cas6